MGCPRRSWPPPTPPRRESPSASAVTGSQHPASSGRARPAEEPDRDRSPPGTAPGRSLAPHRSGAIRSPRCPRDPPGLVRALESGSGAPVSPAGPPQGPPRGPSRRPARGGQPPRPRQSRPRRDRLPLDGGPRPPRPPPRGGARRAAAGRLPGGGAGPARVRGVGPTPGIITCHAWQLPVRCTREIPASQAFRHATFLP